MSLSEHLLVSSRDQQNALAVAARSDPEQVPLQRQAAEAILGMAVVPDTLRSLEVGMRHSLQSGDRLGVETSRNLDVPVDGRAGPVLVMHHPANGGNQLIITAQLP